MHHTDQFTEIASFTIKRRSCLNPNGELLTERDVQPDMPRWIAIYKGMLLTRLFEQKAVRLQRTGRLGIFATAFGQEAITVTLGHTMEKEDLLCPYYRDTGALLQRGVTMDELLLYWGGDERGSLFHNDSDDFPIAIMVASQCLHAAGVAKAFQLRRQQRAVIASCGDGATSRGDFYEALNLAGVWQLPLVFVINNNQWAISVPLEQQTAARTLAQKALAAEVSCEQVDGNDCMAIYYAIREALDKARNNGGPTLIEALTYRVHEHSTADSPEYYRNDEQQRVAKRALTLDPVRRLSRFLRSQRQWNDCLENQWLRTCRIFIEKAVTRYLSVSADTPESIFRYNYASWPEVLVAQVAELNDDDQSNA
ncbi:thiamine pyrophosphate-dependent enzyme [Endozoicomonas sp. SCSIO W0465]|uniref:thiamine pyrophosphate-dependent enzyme n=1 Tax=Endozoicomonas sp. SCSIO W0465 TaxID=2918516 RepID=UPI002075983E|nr:thiamine pyrophosphate-dependent enzyme [Endozoicomonas sp. SCSIO W0465]USE35959.1 thiamine pyrophosphate-dependent enzyme [Endozoicomonas sp. SCSIO W0465]